MGGAGAAGGEEAAQRRLASVLTAWVSRSCVESFGTSYVQGMGFAAALPLIVLDGGGAAEDVLTPSIFAASAALVTDECAARLPRLA
eukprot:gene44318-61101_t